MQEHQSLFEYMSNGQLRTNAVNDPAILAAMAAVPRDHFVPDALKGSAYVDEDLPLVKGRYLLEPLVFATMLGQVKITAEKRVLIIGGGYGYSAAVIARLARAVVMLEEDPSLVAEARQRLAGEPNVEIAQGKLAEGAPVMAPYDLILIEGAIERLPEGLVNQLYPSGTLIALEAKGPWRTSRLLCQYLTVRREGETFFERREGQAFAHRLPGFQKPTVFTL